jgi:hypothetical protein
MYNTVDEYETIRWLLSHDKEDIVTDIIKYDKMYDIEEFKTKIPEIYTFTNLIKLIYDGIYEEYDDHSKINPQYDLYQMDKDLRMDMCQQAILHQNYELFQYMYDEKLIDDKYDTMYLLSFACACDNDRIIGHIKVCSDISSITYVDILRCQANLRDILSFDDITPLCNIIDIDNFNSVDDIPPIYEEHVDDCKKLWYDLLTVMLYDSDDIKEYIKDPQLLRVIETATSSNTLSIDNVMECLE